MRAYQFTLPNPSSTDYQNWNVLTQNTKTGSWTPVTSGVSGTTTILCQYALYGPMVWIQVVLKGTVTTTGGATVSCQFGAAIDTTSTIPFYIVSQAMGTGATALSTTQVYIVPGTNNLVYPAIASASVIVVAGWFPRQ